MEENQKAEDLKAGDFCILLDGRIQHTEKRHLYFNPGDLGEVVDVFIAFYIVFSLFDRHHYFCDKNQVARYIGKIK